jgi:predicted GIY-YIG superfamily endonuclease
VAKLVDATTPSHNDEVVKAVVKIYRFESCPDANFFEFVDIYIKELMANINELKKHHILYRTTNTVTGRFYIGIHSTSNLKDRYLGSGVRFRNELKKYGPKCFVFEILEYCNNRQTALRREFETLETLLNDPNCLNLCQGGKAGGLDQVARAKSKEKRTYLKAHDAEWYANYRDKVSKRLKEHYQTAPGTFTGRTHSSATIEKMKQAAKGRGVGNQNSQYGTCWITNGSSNKKIKKTDPIPEEWYKGRV